MGRNMPVSVIVHAPAAEAGKRELARRVAGVQADFVLSTLSGLKCPASQKLGLLEAVIESVRKKSGAEGAAARASVKA